MSGHRLFLAVVPPREVVDELSSQRGPDAPGVRWTPPSQWHVTLLFTPVVDDAVLPRLVDGLARVAAAQEPFDLAVRSGGAFPTAERARHLVAFLDDPSRSLPALNADARHVADALRLDHRAGDYQPHLTLARMNRPADRSGDEPWLSALSTPTWRVEEVCLVESFLDGPNGTARHVVAERFALGGR